MAENIVLPFPIHNYATATETGENCVAKVLQKAFINMGIIKNA